MELGALLEYSEGQGSSQKRGQIGALLKSQLIRFCEQALLR